MSNKNTFSWHPLLAVFSFDELAKWNQPSNLQDDVAERRAAGCSDDADVHEAHGQSEVAIAERAKAKYWRSLEHLQAEEGRALETNSWSKAADGIDELLARARVSEDALHSLYALSRQLHEGLTALAANARSNAASILLTVLDFAVDDFERLAKHKPDLFIKETRRRANIPALISQHVERKTANNELVKILHVAEEHHLRLPTKPKRGQQFSVAQTPANFWASRLIEYVALTRLTLEAHRPSPEDSIKIPVWAHNALALGDLSPFNWEAWFSVAWDAIMEITDGKPEAEPHLLPMGQAAGRKKTIKGAEHGPLSQAANIRAEIKRRLQDSFRALACGPKGNVA